MTFAASHKTKIYWLKDVNCMLAIALEDARELCGINDDRIMPCASVCEHAHRLIQTWSDWKIEEPKTIDATPNGQIIFSWRKDRLMLDVWLIDDKPISIFFDSGKGMAKSEGFDALRPILQAT